MEWHDENELVRRLDVVEAVLNLADTIDDVVNVIMSVPSYKVQITTNTAMGSDNISTKADRKVEPNCSEKPNNCETCLYRTIPWDAPICDSCTTANSHYEKDEFEPKNEPQSNILLDTMAKAFGVEYEPKTEPQTERKE